MKVIRARWILLLVGVTLLGLGGVARFATNEPSSPGKLVASASTIQWRSPDPDLESSRTTESSTARFKLVNGGGERSRSST